MVSEAPASIGNIKCIDDLEDRSSDKMHGSGSDVRYELAKYAV